MSGPASCVPQQDCASSAPDPVKVELVLCAALVHVVAHVLVGPRYEGGSAQTQYADECERQEEPEQLQVGREACQCRSACSLQQWLSSRLTPLAT